MCAKLLSASRQIARGGDLNTHIYMYVHLYMCINIDIHVYVCRYILIYRYLLSPLYLIHCGTQLPNFVLCSILFVFQGWVCLPVYTQTMKREAMRWGSHWEDLLWEYQVSETGALPPSETAQSTSLWSVKTAAGSPWVQCYCAISRLDARCMLRIVSYAETYFLCRYTSDGNL